MGKFWYHKVLSQAAGICISITFFAAIVPPSGSECESEFDTVDMIFLTVITLSIEDQKRPAGSLCMAWSDRPPIIDPSLLVTWLTEDLEFGLPLPG